MLKHFKDKSTQVKKNITHLGVETKHTVFSVDFFKIPFLCFAIFFL